MTGWVKAFAYMAAAGAMSFVGMELARQAQQRYAADAEVKLRKLVSEVVHARNIDRQVQRELPYLLFAAYEMLEEGADHGEH